MMKANYNFLHTLVFLLILTVGFVSCDRLFNKNLIDNFDPSGRCEELKIDSIAKQKASYEWAMEQLNKEYAERKNLVDNNIFNSSNSALGWLSSSLSESYFEYLSHLIMYEIFLDDESLEIIDAYEAEKYNQSSVLKAKNKLEEYNTLMNQFRNRLVLSPLIESSRGKDYIIYTVSFENSDVQTSMTIKVIFDEKGSYSYWEEI
jgi:hypothetical protein